MSVESQAFLGIGKLFNKQSELIEFLESHNILGMYDIGNFEDGPEYFMRKNRNLHCECLNAFTGNNWFIGYKLQKTIIALYEIDNAVQSWNTKFNITPELISETKWY